MGSYRRKDADRRLFDLLVNSQVVGIRRISIEDLTPARPNVDEVTRDGLPIRVNKPAAVNERGREIERLRHAEGNANQLNRTREPKPALPSDTALPHRRPLQGATSRHRLFTIRLICCGTDARFATLP